VFANDIFFNRPFLNEVRESEDTVVEDIERIPDPISPEWEEEEKGSVPDLVSPEWEEDVMGRVPDPVSPEWEVEDEEYEEMLSDVDRGTKRRLGLDGTK